MKGSLMLQGTASSVGKSLLAAAFCRIFHQDGYRVAPFKAQNMALNSFITQDGLEMGRAQVVQAEAAGIEPTIEMNPILLKPSHSMGSQVIVMGKVVSDLPAREYSRFVPQLKKVVEKAYHRLQQEYEILVLEGAGSPAEVNIKQNDLVNMAMAKMAKSPVILIGDIDRGGVFASLYGTLMLLEPEERALVKGVIINKFRGDISLFESGIRQLEALLHVPVLGVIPYLQHHVEDEDSVTERLRWHNRGAGLTVQVILLPYISNFTDFTPLEMVEDLHLSYVRHPSELENPDLLILPGSKNTLEDRLFLQQTGWDRAIHQHVAGGKLLMGICGGYQILGDMLLDPDGTDGGLKELPGLGLLKTQTEMAKEKTTRQVRGVWTYEDDTYFAQMKGLTVTGYEIHMGQTTLANEMRPVITMEGTDRFDGAVAPTGSVFGTYFHGIFENQAWSTQLWNNLRRQKGLQLQEKPMVSYAEQKEMEYDRLAEHVRAHLDMEQIYAILEKGVG